MRTRYVDIHAHLNLEVFKERREEVLDAMYQEGILAIVVGTHHITSQIAIDLSYIYAPLFSCIGVHPLELDTHPFDRNVFAVQIGNQKIVAVGETGFDFFHRPKDEVLEQQTNAFLQHIAGALEHDMPLMLHIRSTKGTTDAYDVALKILTELKPLHQETLRGNVHFFAGTTEQALAFNTLGFTVSFTGVITFTSDYDEVVRAVPLDMMHAETDAPYVAPEPYRNEMCTPLHVKEVYKAIARIKNLDNETVRRQLVHNAFRDFVIFEL